MITSLLRVSSAIVLITTILHLLVPPCLASIDAAMIRATRATQHRIYLEAHYTYRHLADYNILYGPDVVSSAWELAQFRGVVQPDPSRALPSPRLARRQTRTVLFQHRHIVRSAREGDEAVGARTAESA